MDYGKISLAGKVALVTGGSRGIGRATAMAFADVGADVAISGRKLPDLKVVAEEIRAKGTKALPVASDITSIPDSRNLVDKVVAEFGKIDILFNNAGVLPWSGPLIKADEWAWDTTMNVNLKGLFFLTQMVVPVMRKQGGGSIINASSIAGLESRGNGIYSASKIGVMMLTKAMAKEWGVYGIRVNDVCPGMTKTQFTEAYWKDPVKAKKFAAHNALGRIPEPEDIARVVLFLASDASRLVTGVSLLVDGGQQLGPTPWPD